jgi:hypothetical protein
LENPEQVHAQTAPDAYQLADRKFAKGVEAPF